MGGGRWAVVSGRGQSQGQSQNDGRRAKKALEMKLRNPHTTKQQTLREKVIRNMTNKSIIYHDFFLNLN